MRNEESAHHGREKPAESRIKTATSGEASIGPTSPPASRREKVRPHRRRVYFPSEKRTSR